MPAPSVIRAEIRCEQNRGAGMPPRVFTADITALPQGFVIKRIAGEPEQKVVRRDALPSSGPVTIDQGSKALDVRCGSGRQELVEEPRHVLALTITAQACFVDDRAGVYVVPHDHLKILAGAEGLRSLRIPMAGEQMDDGQIADGIRRYREILAAQVSELDRQLDTFGQGSRTNENLFTGALPHERRV